MTAVFFLSVVIMYVETPLLPITLTFTYPRGVFDNHAVLITLLGMEPAHRRDILSLFCRLCDLNQSLQAQHHTGSTGQLVFAFQEALVPW